MQTELLFKILNTAVLIPWLILLLLPRWKGTQWMVRTKFPVLIYSGVYLALLLADLFFSSASGIDFSSFDSIKQAFGREEVVLLGWVHYLAFDLFIGMWEVEDAQKRKMPHLLLVPCLILTLMFGPVGLLMYWVFRQRYSSTV